jgi:hypothetical protein
MVVLGLIGLTGCSSDRRDRLSVANPTFEEMAQHWFNTFGANPNVESFACALSWF